MDDAVGSSAGGYGPHHEDRVPERIDEVEGTSAPLLIVGRLQAVEFVQ
jgi:hypothetical protein